MVSSNDGTALASRRWAEQTVSTLGTILATGKSDTGVSAALRAFSTYKVFEIFHMCLVDIK